MKLLYAEDDFHLQEMTQRLLERAGHSVIAVGDGTDVLKQLETPEYRPDALVTDNSMSRMDGLEVLRRLRVDPRFKSLPIIVYSSGGRGVEEATVGLRGIFVPKIGMIDNLLAVLDSIVAH